MSVRGPLLTAAAVAACMGLTGCGALSGAESAEGDASPAQSAESSPSAEAQGGGWEQEFPEQITPIIEIDQPGGQAQEEALGAFFALYGDLFTALYEQDTEQAFLTERLTADSPSHDSLGTAIDTFVESNAVPAGDMRFYNGLVGAYSEDTVQVDFCVDQRTFALQDAGSGETAEIADESAWQADIFKPGIAYASTMFEKNEAGEWRSVSFSIDPVAEGDADVGDCL
ncbi:hypothetical protein HDA32_000175 [Spinactinospora alkalitolerans]|uniref:Lipoprotein n=1 Tax=Spinactinospora alkalitolerans TaxID=687207 RepID=A0A852TN87_9ACTN|nr:hypothetical protein [Spinactinospora alkalitolerans]NYE45055.1 hypothetical protein [Spinactinospora alkalitolerans]